MREEIINMATMNYNGNTRELICNIPGLEVLRIIESDMGNAHKISTAIQAAYNKGRIHGMYGAQAAIETYVTKEARQQ